MSSWFECAAFSLYVYRDQDQPPLPDGWSVLFDCPDELRCEGYYAMAFIGPPEKISGMNSYEVVIAHRGTIISAGDLWSDFEVLLGRMPGQFIKGAYLFNEYVRQYINKNYPAPENWYSITHTGHSLGAILAELCVASDVKYRDSLGESFGSTFESPGSKPIIQSMEKAGTLPSGASSYADGAIYIAMADVDAINTCNEQIGYMTPSLNPIGYDYAVDSKDAGILPPGKLLYFSNYTVNDQHKMVKMYQYWKESKEYKIVKKENVENSAWVVGFDKGYEYYLTYEKRYNYWDGYLLYIWNSHPAIHSDYNDDVGQWSDFFISKLNRTQSLRNNIAILNADQSDSRVVSRFTLFGSENDTCGQFVLVDGDEARADEKKEKNKAAKGFCTMM